MKNFLIRWCFVVAFLPIPSVMAQTTSQQSLIDGILSDNKSNASPNSIPAVESAATRVSDVRPAPTGVRRVTALLLPQTSERITGLQIFNAHERNSFKCDFVWPYDGKIVNTQIPLIDTPRAGYITFNWTGSCNTAGMLQGVGKLYVVAIPRNVSDTNNNRGGGRSEIVGQVEFDNGIQKGRILDWKAMYPEQNNFSGIAENFKFSGVIESCADRPYKSCRNSENVDRRFAWTTGAPHPLLYTTSDTSYTCSSNQSDSQCIWASTNYNSLYSQYKAFQAQGQCKELTRLASEIKSKGGVEQARYEEETCQANSQLAAVLSGRDPQAMYLAAARYENNNDRPRAKRIYLTLMEKFPKSGVSVNAADRLSRLADVEAVESATSQAASRAANASLSAAESVRKQNYDQCNNDRLACRDRCYSIRDSSAKSRCQDSCPLCSQ